MKLSQLCKLKEGSNTDSQGNGDKCTYNTIHDICISTEGIDKLLRNLHPDKAAGPDELKPLLYKELHAEIAPILQVIFSSSLRSGTVPEDWTKARVTPIYKKGDKSSAANYRPISLTCIACKIQEHIVTSHLVKHLNVNNILYDLQHGFREKRSCETQLVMLIEDLSRNLQSGKQTHVVLLDFSKAFDKVNHQKLLYKLHLYGVRGQTLSWIKAFLGNRSQTVVVEGEESPTAPVTSGVPQGSVLGPILFLVYINDLPEQVRSKVRLFADDTALYLTLNDINDSRTIQNDLDHLQIWEADWDMEFNPSKCQVIQVSRARHPIPARYSLHGHILEVVHHAKYLGVNIASDLKWNTHVDSVVSKANRSLGLIKRNIKTKHQTIRATTYKTIVRPQLEYAASAWDPHSKDLTTKLEMVQRRAARWTMNDFSPTSSVTSMLDSLGWETLEHRRSCARLALFHNIVYGHVAVPLPEYIVQPTRLTRTAHPLSFRQITTSKDFYKYSFFPLAIVQWNHLPQHVVELAKPCAFKAAVATLRHPRP